MDLTSLVGKFEMSYMPVLFTIIIIDFLFLLFKGLAKRKKESAMNVANYLLGVIPYFAIFFVLQFKVIFWVYENLQIWELPNTWYVFILAFVVYDLSWWFIHYLGHNVRFFWCIHGVHHTPEDMNMSVSIRGSFFDFISSPHIIIWLPVFGFHPLLIYFVDMIARIYGVFTHANDKYFKHTPLMDKIFITPHLHRVHHSRNHLYLDTNYSNMFSFWDRLFRTYQEEIPQEKPVYGVMDRDIDSQNLVSTQLKMWIDLYNDMKSAPNWIDKIKYLYKPPGWNHLDTGEMAVDLRKEAIKEHKL
ncbi:sterol desaturase family protein [Aquimarina spinulae]|uniref:sterol desaturase family protein n=1 Tax=Aquimarina spinulae TaxID=1192023 RepID=UPI000D5587CF|nr:sterol desaturase family protein [Aquimarina spinulae]